MDLDEVTTAIQDKHLRWEAAAPNRLFTPGSNVNFGLRSEGLSAAALQTASGGVRDPLDPPPPSKVDWRDKSAVSPVKDQGNCGSCVAFATCATIESALLLTPGTLVSLSEAHLFFCGADANACESGWDFIPALAFAQSNGIGSAADLPYTESGACVVVPSVAKVTSYSVVHSAPDRRRLIAETGPVLAGMTVYRDFPYYKSGIYEHATGEQIGLHAVCVVGYNDEDNYWIVKNSWGANWGEAGFVRIAYGQAGIETYPFIGVEAALV